MGPDKKRTNKKDMIDNSSLKNKNSLTKLHSSRSNRCSLWHPRANVENPVSVNCAHRAASRVL